MARVQPGDIHNRLLRAMKPQTLERVVDLLTPVVLPTGQVIDRVDGPIKHLLFVDRGVVSMVKTMRDGRSVEVGGLGLEGVTSPHSLLGIDTGVVDAIVQVPGAGFRVRREALRKEVERDPDLRRLIEQYAHFVMGQLVQTAACNRLHTLEERCCRWLLAAHDSALEDRFQLTHEFLAVMLGVQRPSVSLAAMTLKRAGLIDYTRGFIDILDRRGLESMACECYAATRDELDDILRAHDGVTRPQTLGRMPAS
jgi:CRP-like cAMP-binding protein